MPLTDYNGVVSMSASCREWLLSLANFLFYCKKDQDNVDASIYQLYLAARLFDIHSKRAGASVGVWGINQKLPKEPDIYSQRFSAHGCAV